jgi:nucleoside-diphosphate-sugar epimerase
MNSSGKVLILGASGGIGGEVARRLAADNWQVRALKRGAQLRAPEDGMQWIAGDALDAGQVAAAAAGCDVIVHAVNPPGYRHWRQQVLPMLRNTLQAAAQQRALVVLPGTVYNYGPDAFPLIAEAAAQQPVTRKGAIRVEMEQALEDYVQRGGRALIVRAGDFLVRAPEITGFLRGWSSLVSFPDYQPTRGDRRGASVGLAARRRRHHRRAAGPQA